MINGLNKRCTELEGQIIYLHKEQENSLIRRAKKLCGQQDIKSKILKKLIMKCVKLNQEGQNGMYTKGYYEIQRII